SGYINFLRDFKKRYGPYYSNKQIAKTALERWTEMSFRHRCKYYENPVKLVEAIPANEVSSSASSFSSPMDSETGSSGPTDTFFGGRNAVGGSDNVCPKRREPKCGKPMKSCPKPRARCSKPRRSCAKPKPKCARAKPAFPRPRKRMECPKPRARCARPKPRCPKPKPSCPKKTC
ncbi:hypothetical protein KR084_001119, partial [Drosophila pseudotakahashii]